MLRFLTPDRLYGQCGTTVPGPSPTPAWTVAHRPCESVLPRSHTGAGPTTDRRWRSEEHTSELQSRGHLVCRLLLEKKKYGRLTIAHTLEYRHLLQLRA